MIFASSRTDTPIISHQFPNSTSSMLHSLNSYLSSNAVGFEKKQGGFVVQIECYSEFFHAYCSLHFAHSKRLSLETVASKNDY